MKSISTVVASLCLATSLTAAADSDSANLALAPDFQVKLMQQAAGSEKGVIVVLSERGEVAAKAAYLLCWQVEQNPGFKPLLLVPEADKIGAYKLALGLPSDALPAVIFYDKAGKELSRVISALPVSRKLYQIQAAAN